MDYRTGQELKSLDPKDYKRVIVVCGSRHWGDKWRFHKKIIAFLASVNEPVLFVSGAAKSGADRMIIDWCAKFGFPCLQVPADWDRYGKSAGFRRNESMASICNEVIAFWDMESNGTAHMLQISTEQNHPTKIINISNKHANTDHHTALELAASTVCVSGEHSRPEDYEPIEELP